MGPKSISSESGSGSSSTSATVIPSPSASVLSDSSDAVDPSRARATQRPDLPLLPPLRPCSTPEETGGGVAMGGEDCECGAGDDVALDGDGEDSSSIAMSGDSSLTRKDADPDALALLVFNTILRPDRPLPGRALVAITLCISRCCCFCCIRQITRQRREDEEIAGTWVWDESAIKVQRGKGENTSSAS